MIQRIAVLILFLFTSYIKIAADSLSIDSVLYKINIPLFVITTENGEEPPGYAVYPPEGCVGVGLAGNDYVAGTLVVTLGDSVLYDSGEYEKNVSGMRIRQRGNSSALYGKKPYKINLSQKADMLFRNEERFKERDWLLLRSGHTINTPVGFEVSKFVGQRWTPCYSFANLVINGDYKGLYILVEPVEIAEGRCQLSDSGFIIEDDCYWWNEDKYFQGEILPYPTGYSFKSPSPEDISLQTYVNISDYILEVEQALVTGEHISEYIDMGSFAAWLLAHDLLGTLDAGGSNRFLVKYDYIEDNKTSTPLEMGPIWDFDDIFQREGDWAQQHSGNYKFYYKYLLENKTFIEEYMNLWDSLSPSLFNYIMDFIYEVQDSIGDAIDASRKLEDERWNRIVPSNTIDDDVALLSYWFNAKVQWMNDNIHTLRIENVKDNSPLAGIHDVYLPVGRLFKKAVSAEELHLLPRGLYIVSGNKISVGK